MLSLQVIKITPDNLPGLRRLIIPNLSEESVGSYLISDLNQEPLSGKDYFVVSAEELARDYLIQKPKYRLGSLWFPIRKKEDNE